mmetsp:Transcript_8423/g.34212  ORF Transcript_8423/g.34212 Transcript_8423/m.34212 type:complete len:219 (-) Transcript_8423:487-1143(-)
MSAWNAASGRRTSGVLQQAATFPAGRGSRSLRKLAATSASSIGARMRPSRHRMTAASAADGGAEVASPAAVTPEAKRPRGKRVRATGLFLTSDEVASQQDAYNDAAAADAELVKARKANWRMGELGSSSRSSPLRASLAAWTGPHCRACSQAVPRARCVRRPRPYARPSSHNAHARRQRRPQEAAHARRQWEGSKGSERRTSSSRRSHWPPPRRSRPS